MCENPMFIKLKKQTKELDKKQFNKYWDKIAFEKAHIIPTLTLNRAGYKSTDRYKIVNCGRCKYCRMLRQNEWVTRFICEHRHQKFRGIFIGLTYANEPESLGQGKVDFQKFMKRLRKKYPNNGIKYMSCGEKGDKKGRRHLHALITGYIPNDLRFHSVTQRNNNIYTSNELEKLWGHGWVKIGELTSKSIRYTTNYGQKMSFKNDKAYYKTNFPNEYECRNQKGLKHLWAGVNDAYFNTFSQSIGFQYAKDNLLLQENAVGKVANNAIPHSWLMKLARQTIDISPGELTLERHETFNRILEANEKTIMQRKNALRIINERKQIANENFKKYYHEKWLTLNFDQNAEHIVNKVHEQCACQQMENLIDEQTRMLSTQLDYF